LVATADDQVSHAVLSWDQLQSAAFHVARQLKAEWHSAINAKTDLVVGGAGHGRAVGLARFAAAIALGGTRVRRLRNARHPLHSRLVDLISKWVAATTSGIDVLLSTEFSPLVLDFDGTLLSFAWVWFGLPAWATCWDADRLFFLFLLALGIVFILARHMTLRLTLLYDNSGGTLLALPLSLISLLGSLVPDEIFISLFVKLVWLATIPPAVVYNDASWLTGVVLRLCLAVWRWRAADRGTPRWRSALSGCSLSYSLPLTRSDRIGYNNRLPTLLARVYDVVDDLRSVRSCQGRASLARFAFGELGRRHELALGLLPARFTFVVLLISKIGVRLLVFLLVSVLK
jgi:hypothetical protein